MIPELQEVLDSGQLTSADIDGGKYVQKLERQFRDFTKAKYAIAVNSGTTALYASLKVLGIAGSVAFPSLTFKATRNAILASHNTAVPIDVALENATMMINPLKAKKDLVKAVVPVHLYGHVSYIDQIKETEIPVIEDCCQALGSTWKNKSVGRFGKTGCFSFYPSKIISCGEGGMIITDDKNLADQLKLFRNHGDYKSWGLNLRLSEIHASIASHNMKQIDKLLDKRKKKTQRWLEKLPKDITLLPERKKEKRNNQLLTVRSQDRSSLMKKYPESRIYYDYTLGEGVNAEKLSKSVVSFPTA